MKEIERIAKMLAWTRPGHGVGKTRQRLAEMLVQALTEFGLDRPVVEPHKLQAQQGYWRSGHGAAMGSCRWDGYFTVARISVGLTENSMPLEIYKTVVLSTGHITRQDNDVLMEKTFAENIYRTEYGFIVDLDRAHKKNVHAGMSKEFCKICKTFRKRGFRMMHLDGDGPYHVKFPTFDW